MERNKLILTYFYDTSVGHLKTFFVFYAIGILLFSFSMPVFAQSGLEGRITNTINDLVRILNLLILGFIAWSGFLIAKGDESGTQRLIYGVVGLVVVNAASMITNFFQLI